MRKATKFKIFARPVLLIILLALLVRVSFIDTSYVFWDEAEYMMDGQLIATGHTPYDTMSYRPPMVPLLISWLPQEEWMIRWAFVIINSISIYFAYLIGRRFNEKAGLFAALLLALNPFHILYSHYIMTDSIAMLFMMVSFHFYLEWDNSWKAYAGGAFLALSILTKFTSLAFIIVLLPLWYSARKHWPRILGSFGMAFILILPYFIYSWARFGSPFFTFIHGFGLVNISDSTSASSTAGMIFSLLSPLLLCFAVYGFYTHRRDAKVSLIGFWLVFMLIVFIVLVQRGVDKPPGIEWLAERFLLPALPAFVVLSGLGLSKLRFSHATIVVAIACVISYPAYARLFVPAIDLENGLRQVTKEAGQALKDINEPVSCIGNCPPVAYYSGKEISIIYGSGMPSEGLILDFQKGICSSKGWTNGEWSACIYEASDFR